MRDFMKLMLMFSCILSLLLYLAVLPLPKLSAADNNMMISPKGNETHSQGEKIHIRWKNLGEGITYQFQMAKDRDFQQIIIEKICEKSEIAFPHPDVSGLYYVRTRPTYPDGRIGNFSSVQSYEISSKLQPPIITYPKEISELRGIHDITFSWQSVPGAAGYHFVLARDRAFKRIIREIAKADGNSLFITRLDYGIYYVKVSPIANDGTEGLFSDTVSFIITLPPPEGDYY
jgi:hypothetical protein